SWFASSTLAPRRRSCGQRHPSAWRWRPTRASPWQTTSPASRFTTRTTSGRSSRCGSRWGGGEGLSVPPLGHVSHYWDTRGTLRLMNLAAPSSIAIPETTGRVLTVLAGTTRPLSGREVARLSGSPRTTVARVLRDLELQGLANVQEAGAGAALLYSLNRGHLAAEPVLALVNLRQRLIDFLRLELEGWSIQPKHASLFGSAARGDGDSASDIDLF